MERIVLYSLLSFWVWCSSIRRQGTWLRNANWEWFMFLLLNHLHRWQKVQKRDLHRGVLFQRMETLMVLILPLWVLESNTFGWIISFHIEKKKKKKLNSCLLLVITGYKGIARSAWTSGKVFRGKLKRIIEDYLYLWNQFVVYVWNAISSNICTRALALTRSHKDFMYCFDIFSLS